MKKLSIVTILIVGVLLCSSAYSFDGNRKGLTASFGMGLSPYIYSSNNSFNYNNKSEGLGVNIGIGYGINSKNIIYYKVIVSAAMDYENNYCGNINNDPYSGIIGFNWYHYFNQNGSSWFTVLGLGRYVNNYDYTSSGLGFVLGGGYELSKHIQTSTYFYFGKSKYHSIEYSGRTLVFMVTVLAY